MTTEQHSGTGQGRGPLQVPAHVGLIMDGNGRWAASRGLPRFEGHRRGVEALRRSVKSAIELGISVLTVYSFSTENWNRPLEEVSFLMGLLKRFIRNDLAELHQNNVRVKIIGVRKGIGDDIASLLDEAEALTAANTGLTLVVAFNYGSRLEITNACKALASEVAAGRLQPEAITEDLISSYLDTSGLPDPDLIIRTSGEQRLSNFLMWQAAYAEFVFLPIHWPDFDKPAFEAALREFASRDRRFGGLAEAEADRNAKTGS